MKANRLSLTSTQEDQAPNQVQEKKRIKKEKKRLAVAAAAAAKEAELKEQARSNAAKMKHTKVRLTD